ncbi:CHAT domain protein [bacterium BMS3Abin03]|nr:CHAT domain protein [bacterium BMS3Abin03]
MSFNHHLKIILLSILIGAAGLANLSSSYEAGNKTHLQNSKNQNFVIEGENQSRFDELEYSIRNKKIDDKSSFENEILKLSNEFEKEYLLAIFKKRSGEFQESYNILLKLLPSTPIYIRYYEELVELANITDNLNRLKQKLNELVNNNYKLYLKGIISYKEGSYENAIKDFQKLIKDDFLTKEVYYWLAYFNRGIGNYQKGLDLLNKASRLTDATDLYAPRITLEIGSLYYLSGNYEEAYKYYKKGYDEALELKNLPSEIRGLTDLAIIKDETGDVEAARKNLLEAIEKAKTIENLELLAHLYSEIGVSYSFTNELIKARDYYSKSFNLYSKLNNRERLSYLSSNIASIYLQTASYKEALRHYNDGLNYAGENVLGQILNLTGIADVYTNMANYSKSLEYYNKARDLAKSINDISSVAKVEIGLGSLYYNINSPKSSLNFFYNADKIIKPGDMPFLAADIYLKIATVETSLKNYKTAEEYFNKGLKITEATGDIYYNTLTRTEFANASIEQGKLSKAESLLDEAVKMAREYDFKQLIGLQELYFGKINNIEGGYEKALKHFKKAYNFSSVTNDFNNQIEAGFFIAKTEVKNNPVEAEKWFKSTIELIERISNPLVSNSEVQISHFAAFNEVYKSLINFYLSNNKTKEAYNYLERSRSRNTLQNLVNLKLINSNIDERKITRYADLKWMIESKLYDDEDVNKFTGELDTLEKEFTTKNKNLVRIMDQNQALNLQNIQNNLEGDETVISFFITDDYIQSFLVDSSNFKSERIYTGRDELISLIKEITPLYKSIITRDELFINQDLFAFNARSAGKLYEIIFKDLLKNIPDGRKIIFSLPNELLIVPIEFLVTDWDDDQSQYYYADKTFLIEKYPISYTPSASIYIRQKKSERNTGGKILLVGDPDITNKEFTLSYRSGLLEDGASSMRNIKLFPLEFSKDEIISIDALVNNDVVLLSKDATETNLKKNAPGSKIIHLSTHSFLYKDQPLIILSPTDDRINDGFLEMGEIVQMNLNTELVVLSSCRSGLGKIDEAEGILGMQKSFYEAGANSIIVSLWDVNDKYTAIFMKIFYKHLTGGENKTEALRLAKIEFIKNYSPNPYYWSAFILAGDVSKIQFTSKQSDMYYYILGVFILIAAGLILKQRYKLYRQSQSLKIT